MIERNLRRVYGPDYGGLALRRSVQRCLEHYARYWVESFRLPGTSSDVLDAGMSFDGIQHIENAVDRGTGPILALPHLGGWEWGGLWLASTYGHELTVVVEALEPPELFEWFVALRQSFGMHVVPLGPGAGTAVTNAIKAGHVICLVCDRDLNGQGSRSSSSASARPCRPDPPPWPCGPVPRCCRPRSTTAARGTTPRSASRSRPIVAARCART